jgi:cytochrome c oxidase cbb3-type subunit I/II
MRMLGVPYDGAALANAEGLARTQAVTIAHKLRAAGGPNDMANKDVIALIAYMQRLGVDIRLSHGGAQ